MNETIEKDALNMIRVAKCKDVKICRGHGGAAIVRIDSDSADILEKFANETGLSIQKIASNFIKFAGENTIIRFED